jgi:hypothetical protein
MFLACSKHLSAYYELCVVPLSRIGITPDVN